MGRLEPIGEEVQLGSAVIASVRADFAFDCVHAHTSYLDGSAGRWIARRYGVPLVITEHTGPFSLLTESPIVRRETMASLAAADCVIAVSTAQRCAVLPFMAAGRRDRLIVLPNGVDTDLFRPAGVPPGTPARRGDPAAPRFVFVGFLADCKNLPLLLSAFARVVARLPAARLTLVGGGPPQAESTLRQTVEDLGLCGCVTFAGFRDRAAVARILSEEADFLVLSSRSESFGCVVTEAMACGLPVVSTRCGGPEDVVTETWLGRLCENHDPEALARAMLDAAANLEGFDPSRIRRHVEERFSYSALAANLDRVYRQLIAQQKKGNIWRNEVDDPSRLVREVNQIDGYYAKNQRLIDPCQLAWQVNQIAPAKRNAAVQSSSPPRQARRGRRDAKRR